MTDQIPPAALPDPADPTDPRVPPELTGRMLLQIKSMRVKRLLKRVDPLLSGVVLTGEGALGAAVRMRRGEGFDEPYTGVLMVDEERYSRAAATEEQPFPGVPDAGKQLFGDPFEDLLRRQLSVADVALTPTGYLFPQESGALKAAAARVASLDDPRVVFTVPIDAGWLRPDPLKQMVAVLAEVPGAKAIVLGGQMDPLGGFAKAVAGLVELLHQVPNCGLLRTDLAAFGALAWGAGFSSFGADSSMRHTVPPPEPVRTSHPTSSPHVLFPELMDWSLGRSLADKFGAEPAPTCGCGECEGATIDRFTGMELQVEAAQHNTAVLMGWLAELAAVPAAGRPRWWPERGRPLRGVEHHAGPADGLHAEDAADELGQVPRSRTGAAARVRGGAAQRLTDAAAGWALGGGQACTVAGCRRWWSSSTKHHAAGVWRLGR